MSSGDLSSGRTSSGFAMLAALWITIVLGTLGITLGVLSRGALGAQGNRADLVRDHWLVEGCIAAARSSLDRVLAVDARDTTSADVWATLDRRNALSDARSAECDVTLTPVGAALGVNEADSAALIAALRYAGLEPAGANSVTAALLDWRDADERTRAWGAEASWYREAGRALPSNRSFESVAELRLVRGFEDADLDFFTVDSGRVALSHAPGPVLATLPGFGRETVDAFLRLRGEGPPPDLDAVLRVLSQPAALHLAQAAPELASMTTTRPEAWRLRAAASRSTGASAARIEVRLVPAGHGTAIAGWRISSW